MNPNARLPLLAAALTAAALPAALLPAQVQGDATPAVSTSTLEPIPIHTAPADPLGGAYGLWTAADSYKASFHGDMTFVPYLGEDYPRNQPLSWHTESVTVAGRELLPAGRLPDRWHSDYRFEYRFGGVTEVYDVRAEGLEQSFVVHVRPAVLGDLVVTGAVTTALRAAPRDAVHGPLDFCDGSGRAILRYGAAIAFDAAGARTSVSTSYRNGRIALTVPGRWLEEAVFPVTVDPLLGRYMVSSGQQHSSVDIARDETANQLMVVYSRAASATDKDAFARILSDNIVLNRVVFADVTSTWSTPHVRVASSAGQKWCAVFERRLSTNQRAVRFHLRNSGDIAFSTRISVINAGAGRHHWRPDVGGKLPGFNASPEFAIVCQEELTGLTFQNTQRSRIVGSIVDPSGTPGAVFSVAGSLLTDYERPSINQQTSGGFFSPTYWMVACQGYASGGALDDWDLYGKLIDSTGSALPQTWQASEDTAQPHHQVAPQIAGSGGRYLVVYTRTALARAPFQTPNAWGYEVYAQRVDWTPNSNPVNHPEQPQYTSPTPRHVVGGCAFDHETRSHWVFTEHSSRALGGNGTVTYRRVGFRGRSVEGGLVEWARNSAQGLAGGVTFDSDNDEFPLAWAVDSSSTRAAYVSRIDYPWVFPVSPYGLSCSSAQIDWSGSQYIGDEFTSVRLSGAAPNGLAILLVALSQANNSLAGLQMPGCSLLVPTSGPDYVGLVVTTTNGSGGARFPLPLPEYLRTTDLFFQWFHSAPGLNPANLATTRGLRVQIVR